MEDYCFEVPRENIFNVVKICRESSESESDEEEHLVEKTKQRRGKNWKVLKQFRNAEEAESFLKSENTWSRIYRRQCEDGSKCYFRCNKVKKRGPQCDAELCLLYVNDGPKVIAYQTNFEHSHDAIGTRHSFGIHYGTKLEIDKLLDLHFKPKAIFSALGKIEGLKMPTMRQLNNYLFNHRVSRKSAICLNDLEQWIHSHTAIPNDYNEVFVISYQKNEKNEPNFRFVLSTKKLLGMVRFTDIIHVDSTYKLRWHDFSVLIVGTTDRNRQFHPLCFGVANDEQQEDFQIIFEGLKEKVMLIYDFVMKPRVLVCDGAQSIQNAFRDEFGEEPTIRTCWVHTKKNMQKEIEKIVSKEYQKSVWEDVDALHNASSPELFSAAAQAFLLKWQNETRLVKYIQEHWLNRNSNWFLGAAHSSPSTNNSLEIITRSTRDILRERLPLSQFLTNVTDMVAQWSQQTILLPDTVTIELQEWTEAYDWAKKNIKVNIISSDTTTTTYLIYNENAETNVEYNRPWNNFDEYKKQAAAFQKTTLPGSEWLEGTCDCPQYLKKYICKHILGLAIRLKLTKPPISAKTTAIGQKRKRGRPSKPKPALIVQ